MCLYDISDKQLEEAKKAIEEQLQSLEKDGLLRESQTALQLSKNLMFCSDLKEAVDGAKYIQVGYQ